MRHQLGARYTQGGLLSQVAIFPWIVGGFVGPEVNYLLRDRLTQRERQWKAHQTLYTLQIQWIIEVVALPTNSRSVCSTFLGDDILAKTTSPSDGHLMSINKPNVCTIIWKGLSISSRVAILGQWPFSTKTLPTNSDPIDRFPSGNPGILADECLFTTFIRDTDITEELLTKAAPPRLPSVIVSGLILLNLAFWRADLPSQICRPSFWIFFFLLTCVLCSQRQGLVWFFPSFTEI